MLILDRRTEAMLEILKMGYNILSVDTDLAILKDPLHKTLT